ncbi:MAG: hypothetical protein H6712_18835 [Myxococcales bacterium]|nr:hypothetical protein [Myxococcales bacterium]
MAAGELSEAAQRLEVADLPVLPRPVLEPEPWRPPRLSPGFALGWVLTLGVLGTLSAIWLVGMIATTLFLVLGKGGLLPVLAFGVTGLLLGRGWVGMVQSIVGRLRRRDLADPAALPAAFWALSSGVQRLVRHTRSLQIVLRDPGLSLDELDREMFEWLSTMAELSPEDRRFLQTRGLVASQLREELVHSRWSEDRVERQRMQMLTQRQPVALRPLPRVGHRRRALAVLERFERDVLQAGRDPFRGSA